MTDERAVAEAIGGAYRFAANILLAVAMDAAARGEDLGRFEAIVAQVGRLNEQNLDTPAIEAASAEMAEVLAYVRSRRKPPYR